jgi:hypothetical protein
MCDSSRVVGCDQLFDDERERRVYVLLRNLNWLNALPRALKPVHLNAAKIICCGCAEINKFA